MVKELMCKKLQEQGDVAKSVFEENLDDGAQKKRLFSLNKAKRDPWYGALLAQGSTWEQLVLAGFFDDGLEQPAGTYEWFQEELAPLDAMATWCTYIKKQMSKKYFSEICSSGTF